ncbi:hypothetical protein [Acinetobacter genomosp. 15BJ]|uniref:LysM domain-containing protein n=1 Tax=Acinetobacter genomosp. 15BJ TaxID=106651 RepID=A0ABT8UZQ9_9GAMM|nr:hypothetical protein [Acinetobacter genomosp. 15BJ]MCH7290586.1 hypothetical protein [Acinetobacter genomosp. 15BJ]MDO3658539.1 hypothetical protein [Acinetobacter genomosp. 15BJ]
MNTYFSRLKLSVQAPLKLKDLTYKFFVINNVTKKTTTFKGNFDEHGLTGWTEIHNLNTMLIYEVYLRGESLQKIAVKAYPNKKTHSTFTIKMTTEITQKVKQNIKEIYLDDGEVAWYLVKKAETMHDWSKRVFKRPLIASDWDILRANNPHISNIVPIRILSPGMVIVLSNSTTAKELPKYKKDAQDAFKNLEEMKKDKDFDAEFFAQNYEFFYNSLINEDYVGLSHKPIENVDGTGTMLATTAKNTVDGALLFVEETKNRTLGAYSQLVKNYAQEHQKKTRLANPKHFNKFEAANTALLKDFENSISQRMFKWDTGIQTSNLRKNLKSTAFVKSAYYQGGLPAYLKNMNEVGRVTSVLKQGGNFMIGVGIAEAGINIYQATETGENKKIRKAVLVEPLKLGGSLVGGRMGAVAATATAVLVLGVGTGGVGLVVIGACAVAGGIGGGIFGGWIGEMVGSGADRSIEWMTK